MSDRLAALQLFASVARRGSISRAAREIGVSQPTASRMLRALERELGVALVARTTRVVRLTEAGATYLERIEAALSELDEADDSVRPSQVVRGVLRVALTSSVAVREVIPRLPPFVARHPALKLALMIDDRRQNLTEEGIHVSIHVGPLRDSTAKARLIGRWPVAILAAPSYLEKFGHPTTPAELRNLVAVGHSEGWASARTFRKGNASEIVELRSAHSVSSHEGCVAATTAGLGYLVSATLAVRRELAMGSLVRVLADWDLGTFEMHVVFAPGRTIGRAARAFADFILDAGI